MNRAARAVGVCLILLLGAGAAAPISAAPVAPANATHSGAPTGIVLAQVGGPAQARPRERKGIFRFLFRNRENRQQRRQRQLLVPRREFRVLPGGEREAVPNRRQDRRQQTRPRREQGSSGDQPRKERKQRKNRPAAAATPAEAKVVEKAPDAKRVLVLGDFLGGALAKGLTEAFAENANVVVVDGSKGDSGLVRADYYDWTAQIPVLLEEQKPDALLVMIGANDRQSIATEAGSQELGTEGWRLAYMARVSALADALKATTKPVLWVGLAPVKGNATSRDYSALNGIIREQLESRSMRYVDVWNGFADETGKFVGSGPDMNGQPAQLRASDGLNFTRAGQRKLAFFVERELNELLGTAQPLLASTGPADPLNIEPADQPPRIGPMIPLDAVAVAGDALSAGVPPADPGRGAVAATINSRLAGASAAPPPGRADDFAWPPQPLPAAPPPPPGALGPGTPGPSAAAPAPAIVPVAAEPAAAAPAAVP